MESKEARRDRNVDLRVLNLRRVRVGSAIRMWYISRIALVALFYLKL